MPREKELYRPQIARIKAVYPNKEMLNVLEVKKFTGLAYNTVKKRFSFKDGYISILTLAKEMT